MPRPANGYTNAAGQPIPGTHDPIKRFMDQTALKIWAHKQGLAGLPLYQRAAIDIGSTVHGMCELDLKGRPYADIEAYALTCLTAPDHLNKCFASFAAFRAWRERCHVEPVVQEVAMVSETFQYGGTPDTIAMIDGELGLIDFKTSAKPYPDNLIALAAHGHLWDENNSARPLRSYHLIILPKDGSAFQHHAYADLSVQWEIFTLYLQAYRLEKKPVRSATVLPFKAATPAAEAAEAATAAAAKPRRARKPAVAVAAPAAAPLSMAEILRSYGHVKEAAC